MRTRVEGTWRSPQSVNVRVSGTWRQATHGFTRVGGAWREFGVQPLSVQYAVTSLNPEQSNQVLTATTTGGLPSAPRTYSLTSGTLPRGCSFNTSTGSISGPTFWDYGPAPFPSSNIVPGPSGTGTFFSWTNGFSENENPYISQPPYPGLAYTIPYVGRPALSTNVFARLGPNGRTQWVTLLAPTSDSNSIVSTDTVHPTPDGGLVVVGRFRAPLTIGSTSLNSTNHTDRFVAKLSSSGSWQWARQHGNPNLTESSTTPICASAPDGTLYYGFFIQESGHVFNGVTYNTSGNLDFAIAKIATNGAVEWVVKSTGSGSEAITNLVADNNGVYLAGDHRDQSIQATTLTTPSNVWHGFLSRISAAGAWQWSRQFTSSANNFVSRMVGLNDGSVLVSGTFSGTVTIGGTALTSAGNQDAFFARYDSAGNRIWAQRSGGTGNETIGVITGSAIPTAPTVVVASAGTATRTFGSTTLQSTRTGSDANIVRLNTDGTVQWHTNLGGTASGMNIINIIQRPDGSTVALGRFFAGTLSSGGFTISSPPSGWAAFFAVLSASGTVTSLTSPVSSDWPSGALVERDASSCHAVLTFQTTDSAPTKSVGDLTFQHTGDEFGTFTHNALCLVDDTGIVPGPNPRGFPAALTVQATDGLNTAQTSLTLTTGTTRVFGGVRYADSTHFYHVFRGSGSFIVNDSSLAVEVLCVGGGGTATHNGSTGANFSAGGGGGGGVTAGSFTLSPNTYAVSVGGGGSPGTNGSNTSFSSLLTAVGGGVGGSAGIRNPAVGGSGGGGQFNTAGAAGTAGQGNAGGSGNANGGGGGGGAGGAGASATGLTSPGAGGAGTLSYSAWASATATGLVNRYAGGGGGRTNVFDSQSNGGTAFFGVGGSGGGGGLGGAALTQPVFSGTINTGGGAAATAKGGSGIVIVRYLRSAVGG